MSDDFALRAAELHRSSPVVDAHFDLAPDVLEKRNRGERDVIRRCWLPAFRAGGLSLVVSSLFVEDAFLPEMALRRTLDQIAALKEDLEDAEGDVVLCRTYGEIMAAHEGGRIGLLLSFEGAEPLGNDLRLLRTFYELGVRGIGLVWSRRNALGDGCFFTPVREGRKGGLTDFGVQVVHEAERLGMFLDVSHLNDEGFDDMLEFSRKPFIASHSNCRALTATMRNLTDEQIRALADRGGVIGVNAINRFVCGEGEATLDHLLDHVDRLVNIAGAAHVGVGFDFCDAFRDIWENSMTTRDTLSGHGAFPQFTQGLLARGYDEEVTKAILGGNFLRLFEVALR